MAGSLAGGQDVVLGALWKVSRARVHPWHMSMFGTGATTEGNRSSQRASRRIQKRWVAAVAWRCVLLQYSVGRNWLLSLHIQGTKVCL